MASHTECQFNKNSLLQCYFLAILPAGKTEEKDFLNLKSEKTRIHIRIHIISFPLITGTGKLLRENKEAATSTKESLIIL